MGHPPQEMGRNFEFNNKDRSEVEGHDHYVQTRTGRNTKMSLATSEDLQTAEGDVRWRAVAGRDSKADGAFVYAVKTIGIYCRRSCTSLAPNRRNVFFYDNATDAEAKGFRPCMRCNPKGKSPAEVTAEVVASACRIIERAEEMPKPDELEASVGLSPFHFHRQFKAVTGLTPRAYGAAKGFSTSSCRLSWGADGHV
jgi:AraC family transcriptional regulator of adaptative response/methylated-DNA-[protein]-cysteine methyltransferase